MNSSKWSATKGAAGFGDVLTDLESIKGWGREGAVNVSEEYAAAMARQEIKTFPFPKTRPIPAYNDHLLKS